MSVWTTRDKRIKKRRALDENIINNYLRKVQSSYIPQSTGRNILEQIMAFGESLPIPQAKAIGKGYNVLKNVIGGPKYSTHGVPKNLSYGQDLIKEKINEINLMNKAIRDRELMNAVKAAGEWGWDTHGKRIRDKLGVPKTEDKAGKNTWLEDLINKSKGIFKPIKIGQ